MTDTRGGLPVSEPRSAVALRLQALTGLRIFAALAVYFSHLTIPQTFPLWLRNMLTNGHYGVTVFFVLSGFVLAVNYWDRLTRPTVGALWSYGVARFARVYPLLLIVIAYMMVSSKVDLGYYPSGWGWHLVGLNAWGPDVFTAYAFGPAWSLSVEFFLYATLPLIVPLLIPIDRSLRRLLTVAAVTVLVMIALAWGFEHQGFDELPWSDPRSAHRWLYRMPLTRLGDFLLGVIAARLYVRARGANRVGGLLCANTVGGLLSVAGVIGILGLAASPWNLTSAYLWDVAYAVPSALLIFGLAIGPRAHLARVMATQPVVFLGEASYAFYLTHTLTATQFGGDAWGVGISPTSLTLTLFGLGGALCVAIGLFVAVERPARVGVRRVLDRPRRARHAAAPAPSLEAESGRGVQVGSPAMFDRRQSTHADSFDRGQGSMPPPATPDASR